MKTRALLEVLLGVAGRRDRRQVEEAAAASNEVRAKLDSLQRELGTWQAEEIEGPPADQVIARAMREGKPPTRQRSPIVRRMLWLAPVAAAAVALIAILPADEHPRPDPASEVTIALATGESRAIHGDSQIAAVSTSRVTVHRSARRTAVDLHRGHVRFEVAKRPERAYEVETADALIRVTGTIFTVETRSDPVGTSIRVEEGSVHWLDKTTGSRRSLRAGDTATTLVEPPHANDDTDGMDDTAPRKSKRSKASQLTRSERAEAALSAAEQELAARRFAAAADRYLGISRRFRDLPQAEVALFTAAQIAAAHEIPHDPDELLRRYLRKYPRGRFAVEAEALLKRSKR